MKCGPFEVNVIKSPHHRSPWIEVWRMEYADNHHLIVCWQKNIHRATRIESYIPWMNESDRASFRKDFEQIMELYPVSLLKDVGKPSDIWPDGI